DLELRGAGNMLGGEQSGHIEAIGFELYTTMLEEAVRKMKGEEEAPAHATTTINLGISVRIDSGYIPEENQRLRMYKRVAGAQTHADLADVRAELQDRYGTPPEAVLNLLAASEIRLRCEQLGISQLDRKRTQIELPNPNGNSAGGSRKAQPLKTFVGCAFLEPPALLPFGLGSSIWVRLRSSWEMPSCSQRRRISLAARRLRTDSGGVP